MEETPPAAVPSAAGGPRAAAGSRAQVGAWPLDRLDALLAVGLVLAAFALYRGTLQTRQFGDGPVLLQLFSAHPDGSARWGHVLFMPVAAALWRAFDWASPSELLRFVSNASGALGVGCTYLVCRSWVSPRPAALVGTLLLALSPGYWFFSTTVEIHALHAACVGLCACVTLLAPWRRPLLALLLAAGCLPIVFLSHQSGLLLGLGFVLLAQHARARSGQGTFGTAALLLGVGPLFLASFAGASLLAAYMDDTTVARLFNTSNNLIATYDQGFSLANSYNGWVQPLALILPMVVLVVALRRLSGLRLLTSAALVLPSLAFFLDYGLPERGGFTLGTAGFLAAAAALLLPTRPLRALGVGALLVALQGTLGYTALRAYDSPSWTERNEGRALSVARALPGQGTLISINTHFQYIEPQLPQVVEVSIYRRLTEALATGLAPEDFAAEIRALVERQLGAPGNVVAIDLSYRPFIRDHAPQLVPYIDALEAELAARFRVTRFEDERWPVARIE